MKTPLKYQTTEYDCAPTSLTNALICLFERESIPLDLLKIIYTYSLDEYSVNGNIGEGGTSKKAMELISKTINDYAKTHDFNIQTTYLKGKKVNIKNIRKCLNEKGYIILRTYLYIEHYVLITNIDEHFVYIWDPYYLDERYKDKEVLFLKEKYFNRIINIKRFKQKSKKDFSMGPIKERECILLNN